MCWLWWCQLNREFRQIMSSLHPRLFLKTALLWSLLFTTRWRNHSHGQKDTLCDFSCASILAGRPSWHLVCGRGEALPYEVDIGGVKQSACYVKICPPDCTTRHGSAQPRLLEYIHFENGNNLFTRAYRHLACIEYFCLGMGENPTHSPLSFCWGSTVGQCQIWCSGCGAYTTNTLYPSVVGLVSD